MKKLLMLLWLAVLCAWTGLVASLAQHPDGMVWRNLSPAVWFLQGVPLEATYTPSALISLQRGTIAIGAGATTANATITAVTLASARVRFLGGSLSTGGSDTAFGYVTLPGTTTVTATRWNNVGTLTVGYEVAAYLPQFIKSVQRGTITNTNQATNTATVTSVNTARAELDYLGNTTSDPSSGSGTNWVSRLDLTNATTITATMVGTTVTLVTSYQLLEWK